jgi:hypothetical protein
MGKFGLLNKINLEVGDVAWSPVQDPTSHLRHHENKNISV